MEKCCWGLDPGCTEETRMEPFSHHCAPWVRCLWSSAPENSPIVSICFDDQNPPWLGQMGSPPWLISGGRLLLSRGSSPQIHQGKPWEHTIRGFNVRIVDEELEAMDGIFVGKPLLIRSIMPLISHCSAEVATLQSLPG